MRVLLLYYEPRVAGQTTHVLALARGLDKRCYQLTVALPERLQECAPAFEQAGATVARLGLGKLTWNAAAIRAVARMIRQQAIDVVHIHSQEAGLLGRLVARAAGARTVIYTPQTIDIRQTRWHWLYRQVECGLAYMTDAIVSVNEADRARLISWGIAADRVVTIPNGIDLSPFEGPVDVKVLRQVLGVDTARPLVMQVGRLSAQKDPLAFVEGAALVARQRPDAQFALLGEGPLSEAVARRVVALGLGQCLHLLGWRAEGVRLIPAADVVTLTSGWEGTPHALLEAMAWSRPVVTTTVNGCPEIVADGVTGWLAPPGDVITWAGRVLDLLNDPARAAKMGRQGRQRLEAEFSLPKMVARIEGLYQQVAGRRHS